VRDLALDPTSGDLLVEQAALRLTSPAGAENVAQHLGVRLALWQGEYPLDRRVGVPYVLLLGQKGARALLASTLRQSASSSPGVDRLDAFALNVDADRNATCSIAAVSTSGDPLRLDDFVVSP
jgi:hypothetical protein